MLLKLIGIIVAAMPVLLLVRAIFMGSKQRAGAMSRFVRQIDYAVSVILFMIACGLVFSVGRLIYQLVTATTP